MKRNINKNSRKWRKLKFIRTKNGLSSGKVVLRSLVKIVNEEDLQEFIPKELERRSKYYKMNLNLHDCRIGYESDDFIKKIITAVLTIGK